MVHFTLKSALAGLALVVTVGTMSIPRTVHAHAQVSSLRHAELTQCTSTTTTDSSNSYEEPLLC